MTCDDITPFISAYVDNELKGRERLDLICHLEICDKCRLEMVETDKAKTLLESQPSRAMPSLLRNRIEQDMDEEDNRISQKTFDLRDFVLPKLRWAFAGGAMAIALVAGLAYFQKEETVPLQRLLMEHVKSSRRLLDTHRFTVAAAPYQPVIARED
ncbi:zf-HC2 domain-containing protein [Elusimicrobiota bacterium]